MVSEERDGSAFRFDFGLVGLVENGTVGGFPVAR